MIPVGDRGGSQEVALGLIGALAPVLADLPTPGAMKVAGEAAQLLGLDGLGALLAICAPHAGRAWPMEVLPALDRLRRLTAQAAEAGSVEAFQRANRELAGLADEISVLHWSPVSAEGLVREGEPAPVAERSIATLSLADTLDEMPLADDASREVARVARLLPPVAAALRAALDWLVGDSDRSLTLRAEGSVLEVMCDRIAFQGLGPASAVLAAVQGNLGPVAVDPPGAWSVRVALHAARTAYLMLVQGGVPIAIPWHAVLRLRMAEVGEAASRRDLGEWPLVDGPFGPVAGPAAGGVPLALVAHGRKRAWIAADRLVWRLDAEPAPPLGPAPDEGLTSMVRTEEGDRYWLAEPSWLLRTIEAPALARPVSQPVPPEAAAPRKVTTAPATPARPSEAKPAPAAGAAAARPDQRPVRDLPRLRLLTPADVEPIGPEDIEAQAIAPPASARPAPPVTRSAPARAPDSAPRVPVREAQAPPARLAPAPGPRPLRTALVAEDSLTARMFLTRSLERLGFEVRGVETAAALRAELERGVWSVACVDVELPDDAGLAFLAGLIARHGGRTPFVALVRDVEDRVMARNAGMDRMVRKPFDESELEQVLNRLGLIPRRA